MSDLSTFSAVLRALEHDHRPAQTFLEASGTIHRTRHEVLAIATEYGQRLAALGLRSGDRVGLMIASPSLFIPLFHACLLRGYVAVPMYPPLAFGRLDAFTEQAAGILREAGARILVTDAGLHRFLYALVERVPTLNDVVAIDRLPAPVAVHEDDVSPESLAFLQYTSGSTSTPKGVRVTHASLLANCEAMMRTLAVSDGDVGVSWLPLYHDMGLIGFALAPMVGAGRIVFIPTLSFLRDPALWLRTLHDERGTITFAPNFAYAIAAKRIEPDGLDLSRVRVWGCGAEPVQAATMRAFERRFEGAGVRAEAIMPAYGLAESTLGVAFDDRDRSWSVDRIAADDYLQSGRARPSTHDDAKALEYVSCGRPLPGLEIEIVEPESGQALPERVVGEIVVRGSSLAQGYHGDAAKTASTFRANGLRTGDKGYLADGRLYVTGRLKDVVILRGRNYDPQSIEEIIGIQPGVRTGSVMAFNRPGQDGEELVVVAETRTEPDVDPDRIRRELANRLGLYIDDLVLLPAGSLPKTSSGKLQRSRARELYLEGRLGQQGNRTPGTRAAATTVIRHLGSSYRARIKRAFTNAKSEAV